MSLVGRNIRSILDELGPALEVFEEQHIYMLSQAASDLNLTFVVDEDQAGRLVRKLHSQLFSKRLSDRLFGPDMARVAGRRAAASEEASAWWEHERERLLDVAEDGPATSTVSSAWRSGRQRSGRSGARPHVLRDEGQPE